MFNVQVFNVVSLYLKEKVQTLSFISSEYGCITIAEDHEDCVFKMDSCKIHLKTGVADQILFSGFGLLQIENGDVSILACPVDKDFEQFKLKCHKIGRYGQKCLETLEVFHSIYNL